jgi:Uri superfamily endonuclease
MPLRGSPEASLRSSLSKEAESAVRGSYVLLIELPERREIAIGGLGRLSFPEGYYAYVGSAMNGIETRLRHHSRQKKKPHWHIDYLLEHSSIRGIVLCPTNERIECSLARALAGELPVVRGFGSSDCRCEGHLYFSGERDRVEHAAKKAASYLANPVWVERG